MKTIIINLGNSELVAHAVIAMLEEAGFSKIKQHQSYVLAGVRGAEPHGLAVKLKARDWSHSSTAYLKTLYPGFTVYEASRDLGQIAALLSPFKITMVTGEHDGVIAGDLSFIDVGCQRVTREKVKEIAAAMRLL